MSNVDPSISTVWANDWNPVTDEWDPNTETLDPWGVGEPGHGDEPVAEPISEQYGGAPSGTVPEVGANLLTDVRGLTGSRPFTPPQEHHHVVETIEKGASRVRARVVRVVGNTFETVLMEPNDNRTRALIKVVTTASAVIIGPIRQGGNPAFTAAPAGPAAFWFQATGDPMLEVKASSGVSCYGTSATGQVDVSVWEELEGDTSMPGLY